MNENDIVLRTLNPPPGGLEHLRARRDSRAFAPWTPWLSVAAGGAFALAVTLAVPRRAEVHMQLNGARLIAQQAQGVDLRVRDGAHTVVSLPSDNPQVRIYWLEAEEPVEPAH
jgi:hypothetical protein